MFVTVEAIQIKIDQDTQCQNYNLFYIIISLVRTHTEMALPNTNIESVTPSATFPCLLSHHVILFFQ